MFHQKTVCQKCNNVSHRWEPFNSLKVPIPVQDGPCDIMAALKKDLLHEETIDDYECDTCGLPRPSVKKSVSIWKLPLVLTMSVKRFVNSGQKIHTPVMPVPSVVDFTPYFSQDSPEREATIHYALRGMVDHHGGAMGGHYTAQCRNNDSGTWYRYDDEAVHAQSGPQFGESTYMFFFERA
jgi:ubiquitin C-terminal hydrolase